MVSAGSQRAFSSPCSFSVSENSCNRSLNVGKLNFLFLSEIRLSFSQENVTLVFDHVDEHFYLPFRLRKSAT